MTTSQAVAKLRRLIKRLVSDGVTTPVQYQAWRKVPKNAAFMGRCLGYKQGPGMPAATAVVKPHFHPTQPFIGLNYTPVAHNTLHNFGTGWTDPVKLCRGIVFDHTGRVLAFPFPKFFNYGESAETRELPNEPFVATVKQDGHLGIIFEANGELFVTTRGSFISSTSVLATSMLDQCRSAWQSKFPKGTTVLAEIIAPDTRVHVDYGDTVAFRVIGAFNRRTFKDYDYEELKTLAKKLCIDVTPQWTGNSIADLAQLMLDPNSRNEEGYVARFSSGLRVKFKFKNYIGLMIGEKLSARWVMRRMQEGKLEERVSDLPGEVTEEIRRLRDILLKVKYIPGDKKARFQYLYELEDDTALRTDYYKSMCRKFYAWLLEQQGSADDAA